MPFNRHSRKTYRKSLIICDTVFYLRGERREKNKARMCEVRNNK